MTLTPEVQALVPRIYEVVKQVPSGQVTTYGAVAQIVGGVCDARLVGAAMAAVDDPAVPWPRVVNAKGMISERGQGGMSAQRKRLEAEGVAFDARGRIDLERFGWPGPDPAWASEHGFQVLPSQDKPDQLSLL